MRIVGYWAGHGFFFVCCVAMRLNTLTSFAWHSHIVSLSVPPIALLPEGFKPAPRETEADKSGKTDTLDRKLKDVVFFVVDNKLPTTSLENPDSESLLDAAKRAISENGGSQLELYCPSHAPVAVSMTKAEEGSPYFGTKTFFLRIQYDDGMIQSRDLKKKQMAWLDRSEIMGLFEGSRDDADAKFYRYLL